MSSSVFSSVFDALVQRDRQIVHEHKKKPKELFGIVARHLREDPQNHPGFTDVQHQDSSFYQVIKLLQDPRDVKALFVIYCRTAEKRPDFNPVKIFRNILEVRNEKTTQCVSEYIFSSDRRSDFVAVKIFLRMNPQNMSQVFLKLLPEKRNVLLKACLEDEMLCGYIENPTHQFFQGILSEMKADEIPDFLKNCMAFPCLVGRIPFKKAFETMPKDKIGSFFRDCLTEKRFRSFVVDEDFLLGAYLCMSDEEIPSQLEFGISALESLKPFETIFMLNHKLAFSFFQKYVENERLRASMTEHFLFYTFLGLEPEKGENKAKIVSFLTTCFRHEVLMRKPLFLIFANCSSLILGEFLQSLPEEERGRACLFVLANIKTEEIRALLK